MQHQITLEQAIELTTRYRNNPVADMALSETFEAASVSAMLNQPGCQSMRIYLGRKADNSICSVLVAADAEGHDILPPITSQQSSGNGDDEGIILEDAFRCPPVCAEPSPLNNQ